jgi:hypothetical protein
MKQSSDKIILFLLLSIEKPAPNEKQESFNIFLGNHAR